MVSDEREFQLLNGNEMNKFDMRVGLLDNSAVKSLVGSLISLLWNGNAFKQTEIDGCYFCTQSLYTSDPCLVRQYTVLLTIATQM